MGVVIVVVVAVVITAWAPRVHGCGAMPVTQGVEARAGYLSRVDEDNVIRSCDWLEGNA